MPGYLCLDAGDFEGLARNWRATLTYMQQQNAVNRYWQRVCR